jgi:hypothetical protein
VSEAPLSAGSSGLVLGRWRPLRPLGSGGSGSVWLALDEKHGLEVALKIVPREGKAATRAEREALAAAQLRHERCLRAYGLARDARHVYIAYEYVPGRTLREALRGRELDDARAVEAAAQILDALAHAHARGIVHRDVKPSNVLLAETPEVSVRLLDFGLARMREAETLTGTGDVPGTLAYIAPERLGGEAGTPASDVWGVGVLLWEALAGFHPFWRSSLLETARGIERGAPPLETVRPDLPRPLLVAVDRALALDPARRPSAARLADALRGAARRPRRGGSGAGTLQQTVASSLWAPAASAALAAAAVGWTAAALSFYPAYWPFALAAIAAAAAAFRPRLGLAFTLFVPFFPLGNIALGLAVLWAALAVAWFAAAWREPRAGFLFALGPALGPIGALPFLTLATSPVRSWMLRAVGAAAAVVAAAVVAGVRGAALPFTGARAPQLAIAGSERPTAVAAELVRVVAAHPALGLEAAAVAAAAAVLPAARARGLWGVTLFAAALMSAVVLAAPAASAVPAVISIWATFLALACTGRRRSAS